MVQTTADYRPATIDDAEVLAKLVDFAGEGLPVYLWNQAKNRGETVWAFGRRCAMRKEGNFSYRNATVAEINGQVVGSLLGYKLAAKPGPIDADMPAVFKPLQELENLAPATWYVTVLAVYPEHRRRGLGTKLLSLAEIAADDAGLQSLSIIVSDGNHEAKRLYEKSGYVERATRLMVKEKWSNPGRNWVLLTKNL